MTESRVLIDGPTTTILKCFTVLNSDIVVLVVDDDNDDDER
jgi:hypothetical protein